ncbi:MAG: hypothetical protein RXN79_02005 [Candidatus Nanopusillus sp.]|jgi:hypothetical protein
MSEELKDVWSVEIKTSFDVDNIIYEKKVLIIIKNHSPYFRKFEVGTKYINIEDQYEALKFRVHYNLISPVVISIDKYRKEIVEVFIPKINHHLGDNIIFYVKNLDKNEEKEVQYNL